MANSGIRVGGFEGISLCDWPGRLVATVFLQGCPWNCHYCHNAHLIPARSDFCLDWEDIVGFLETRRGLLDGVVFSGGEPTLQKHLAAAMRQVRAMGYSIGLHTGGAYPDRLSEVLPLVDWVGYDIKAEFADYARVTDVEGSGAKAREGLVRLLASGVEYQLRTTVDTSILDDRAIARMRADLEGYGATEPVMQTMRPRISVR